MTMMARHKESNCDGCRRASSDCSRFCKPGVNITESEERDMKGLHITSTAPQEIKNILYPVKKPSMWQCLFDWWDDIVGLLGLRPKTDYQKYVPQSAEEIIEKSWVDCKMKLNT